MHTRFCLRLWPLLAAVLALSLPASTRADELLRGFQPRTYTDSKGDLHRFVVYIPSDFVPFDHERSTPPPIMLFLHGSGERGDNGIDQMMVGLAPAIWKIRKTFPFVVVFPQCQLDKNWKADGPDARRALAMLEQTEKELGTDPERVYLTGLSMGGDGTWSLAAKYPNRFAAIAPMCSPADVEIVKTLTEARLPIWNFCGDLDEQKTVDSCRKMHAALIEAGANARYTEYPRTKHNCWDNAYGTGGLYTWMLQYTRPRDE